MWEVTVQLAFDTGITVTKSTNVIGQINAQIFWLGQNKRYR